MKHMFLPFWMIDELEKHFLNRRKDFIESPTDEKLEELEYIQEERRIQDPSKRVIVHLTNET